MRERRVQRAERWRLGIGCCESFVLWEPNGDGIPVDEVELSDALKDELTQWRELVVQHVDADGEGWEDARAQAAYERRGRWLRAWLQHELGADVDLDLRVQRVGW